MNYQANNKKENKDNNSRALYITLVAALSIMAVLIAVAGIAGRISSSNTPVGSTDTQTESKNDTKNVNLEADISETEKYNEMSEKEINTDDVNVQDTEAEPVIGPTDSIPKYFHTPVNGIISKEFSNTAAVYSNTMNDYRIHNGVDVACEASAPVMAVADGTVSAIWDDPMNGTSIKITHSGGAVSTYHNLSSELPEGLAVGSNVRAGDIIATVGETSLLEIADEYHLHYELSINDENVNPCDYIVFDGTISYDE